jgi:hypothetical protein
MKRSFLEFNKVINKPLAYIVPRMLVISSRVA